MSHRSPWQALEGRKYMELKCNDLMEGCSYAATGNTEDEVLNKMWQHHKSAHSAEDKDEIDMKDEWRGRIKK